MPRRSGVKTACQSCRRSRTRCDGSPCCARCKEKHLECSYDRPDIVSKMMLRTELQDVKKRLAEANILLDALKSDTKQAGSNSAAEVIIQGLSRGDSREFIVEQLNCIGEKDNVPCALNLRDSAVELSPLSTRSSCAATRAWLNGGIDRDDISVVASVGSGTSSTSPSDASVLALSCPNTPYSAAVACEPSITATVAESSSSQLDSWTNSNFPKPYVRELIISVLDWDAVPFCLVEKELFLSDFDSGETQYCSSALVSALLALATRLLKEQQAQSSTLTSGITSVSDTFVRESSTHLRGEGTALDALPNIQAVGVLALFEASFGKDTKAARLVDEYAAAIVDLCFSEPTPPLGSDYEQVRAHTYRGAMSLRRICQLTGVTTTSLDVEQAHHVPFVDMSKSGTNVVELADSFGSYIPGGGTHQTSHRDYLMTTRVFQLAGWLHKAQVQHNSELSPSIQLELYFRCLNWYSGFFAIEQSRQRDAKTNLGHDDHGKVDSRSLQDLHFSVFTHMFYYFCILRILSPATSNPTHLTGNLLTRDICREAAQSILALSPRAALIGGVKGRQSPGRLTSRFISTAKTFLARPFLNGGLPMTATSTQPTSGGVQPY